MSYELRFCSFPFFVLLIGEEDDYKYLVELYRQSISSQSSPVSELELKPFQIAARTPKSCMRRNDKSH